jgi:hypothetical protein
VWILAVVGPWSWPFLRKPITLHFCVWVSRVWRGLHVNSFNLMASWILDPKGQAERSKGKKKEEYWADAQCKSAFSSDRKSRCKWYVRGQAHHSRNWLDPVVKKGFWSPNRVWAGAVLGSIEWVPCKAIDQTSLPSYPLTHDPSPLLTHCSLRTHLELTQNLPT